MIRIFLSKDFSGSTQKKRVWSGENAAREDVNWIIYFSCSFRRLGAFISFKIDHLLKDNIILPETSYLQRHYSST